MVRQRQHCSLVKRRCENEQTSENKRRQLHAAWKGTFSLIAFVSTGTVEFVNTILKYSPCRGMKKLQKVNLFLVCGN